MAGARAAFNRMVERLEPLETTSSGSLPADDPRPRLVAAYQRLAEIAISSFEPDEAVRNVARAIVHAEALVRQHPADTFARLNLSQIYREDAESLSQRKKYPEALARMRESRRILDELMRENPLMGDPLAAISVYRHQFEIARTWAQRDPKDNSAQIASAVALRLLGDVLRKVGRVDEARASLQEGRGIMAAVVARDPTNGWARDGLAEVTRLHGEVLRLDGNPAARAQACSAFREAHQHYLALSSGASLLPASLTSLESTESRLKDECSPASEPQRPPADRTTGR